MWGAHPPCLKYFSFYPSPLPPLKGGYTYIPTTYIPTYLLHTDMPARLHTYRPTELRAYISTCLHTYPPTYPPTYLPTYRHKCLHTYLHTYLNDPTCIHACIIIYNFCFPAAGRHRPATRTGRPATSRPAAGNRPATFRHATRATRYGNKLYYTWWMVLV